MLERSRRLPPSLQHRRRHTNTSSILHRATGVVLSAYYLVLACWLMALAEGPVAYAHFVDALAQPVFKMPLTLGMVAAAYHLCNGVLRLLREVGVGLGRREEVAQRTHSRHGRRVEPVNRTPNFPQRHSSDRRVQRVTALALLPLAMWGAASLLAIQTLSYTAVTAWMARGPNAVLLAALVMVAAEHSYLGQRDIVEDYVHEAGMRIAMVLLVRFVHLLSATAAVLAILVGPFGA